MKLFQICRLKWWLILCCAVLAACEMTMLSRAEETKKLSDIVAFTGIALCYIDENGMPEEEMVQDGALIEKDARLALRYTYEIPEEKISAIEADIPYYLEVSPHLILPDLKDGSSLTVKSDEGTIEFGKISADGASAWITFTGKEDGSGTVLSELGELQDAFFYLQCRRAEDPPETETPVEGKENLYAMKFENGEELLFGYAELERTEAKAKIEKGGDLRDKTIVWTIDYTPWQNPGEETGITSDTPFELSDRIDDAMHGYVAGSIRIDGVPVADYVSRDDIPEDADAYALIEASDSGTVLHIGGKMLCAGEAPAGKPAKPIRIMYETTLRDELLLPGTGGDKKVINSAELLAEEGDIFHNLGISGKYEVAVKPPKWMEKTGKTTRYPDGTGSATDWTVTFHPNGFTFTDDNELTLHDQLPAGSTLVPGTVRKNGVSVPVKETENNGFTVLAGEAKEQPVVITYQTTVPEEMYDSGTSLGDNIAWFTFRYQEKDYETPEAITPVGSGDGSGTSGTATLVKENGGYHADTRSIDWTVKINPHKAYLKGGTFTDDLGDAGGNCGIAGHTGGLKLPNDSVGDIRILIDGSEPGGADGNLVKLEYDRQVITVTAGEIGARTITLLYTTKVCDPCIFANNTAKEKFVNRIATTNMVIGKNSAEKRSASAQSPVDVSAAVLTKKAPLYDYASGIMKWTLEVDGAGLSMTDVVLTDVLPAGLACVDSSFRTEPEIPGARLTASGQELTFDLGDVNTKTLVMFDTKVDPEKAGFNSDGDVKIENTARMKGEADGVIFMEVSHRVEQKFVNHGLLKSSKTDNKNEWIEYEVLINPFGLSLPQTPALVDTLDKRLQIDEDTLRFYKANLSGNSGSTGQKPVYTKIGNGEPLKIADCDPAANSFTVYLPISAGSRDAYVLSYRADILERQAGGYGNSVRFEGGSVRLGGTKQNSAPVGGGGGGGGGVASRRVGITITQTDNRTNRPLAGVTYTLYRWDQDNNRRGLPIAQGITDAQGRITFRVKPGAVYELVQTGAVSGYDDAPGWAELPEGITQGGGGLLITAGLAGSERKLELTNEADDTNKPDGSGGTGDTGGSGSPGDSGNTGGSGGSGSDGDSGNSGGTEGSASSGSADSFGHADSLSEPDIACGDGISGNISEHMLTEEEGFGLTKPGGGRQGRATGGAQTGDRMAWLVRFAFIAGTISAVGLVLLYLWRKKRRERE